MHRRTHKRVLISLVLAFGVIALIAAVAEAQMMPAGQTTTQPAKHVADADAQDSAKPWLERYFGEGTVYRGLIVGVLTFVVLIAAYRFGTKRMRAYLSERAYKPENVQKFMRTWKSVWSFVIAVFVLMSFSGSFRLLGLSAGFLGMMLGWSLQAPVTGIAAWLMVVAKKPFRIGDRVIIGGTIGDVTDITLTHIVLNQVGGTIGGEEKSGRGILIPNAILFSQIITNYTLEQKYMLDEVPVRVSFESDVELAKEILLKAAGEVTRRIIDEIGQEPFLRLEFYDAGVLIRLRYQTEPSDRQRISSEIVDIVLREFKESYPKVRFGYPHSVISYRKSEDTDTPPALTEPTT